MNKLISKIVGVALGLTLATGTGVAIAANNSNENSKVAYAADSGLSPTSGSFIIDFYDSTKLSSTTGTTLSSSNYANFVKVASGLTNTDVVTGVSVSGTAQYGKNGGLTLGANNTNAASVTFSLGSSYRVNKITLYGAIYDSGATLTIGGNEADSGSLAAKGSAFNSVTSPLIWDNLGGISSINLSKTGKRVTAYTLVCEYGAAATLSSIALSGSMTKTDYTTAEEWDPAGLVVTGTFSDSTTANLTSGSTFKYYNSSNAEVATPKALGVGSGQTLKVVASYTGVSDTAKYTASSSINVTKATEFTLVTDVSKLTKDTTFILVGTGSYNSTEYTKAMVQGRTTSNSASTVANVDLSDDFNGGSVATTSGTVFTLGGSAGAWTIKNGNNQLGFTGTSNNNMQFNENQTDTFKITAQSGYLLSIESNAQSGRKLQYNVNNGDPRFSNYNGGQTYIYMFANIAEAQYGTTNHITIGTMPETEFAVGDSFNSTGLTLTAWDGADETTANSKTATIYATSLDSTTFSDSDIGSQTVTVYYTENGNTYSTSYSIYVYASATYELVTEEPTGGWSGSYLITTEVTTAGSAVTEVGTYAMKSTLDNFDVVGNYRAVSPVTDSVSGKTTIVAGQHLQFSISAITGGYSIQGLSGKYIGWGSASSNGLTSSTTALVNTIAYDDVNGVSTILCSAGTKGLMLNTSSGQFRYYSNSSVQLYKLVESSEAAAYAADFLELLSTGANAVCDAGGESDLGDLQTAWAILATDFAALSNADKQQFTQGAADESGNDINKALALYDYIATKYGTSLQSQDCSNYNFMGRSITPASANVRLATVQMNNNALIIVVITAFVSATFVGGYFLLRKKKEN